MYFVTVTKYFSLATSHVQRYLVDFEEVLDLLALSTRAHDQQVAQLVDRPQFVEDATPLQCGQNTTQRQIPSLFFAH